VDDEARSAGSRRGWRLGRGSGARPSIGVGRNPGKIWDFLSKYVCLLLDCNPLLYIGSPVVVAKPTKLNYSAHQPKSEGNNPIGQKSGRWPIPRSFWFRSLWYTLLRIFWRRGKNNCLCKALRYSPVMIIWQPAALVIYRWFDDAGVV